MWKFILLFACLNLPITPLQAAAVDGLFSARVPVADRSDTEYKRGVSRALEAVIVKLTGSSAAAKTKAARGVIGKSKNFIQQFGYEKSASDAANASLLLRVEFDARVLSAAMRERNLTVWGKERPDTLVWIIIDDQTGRRLLTSADDSAVVSALRTRAYARGIPVIIPSGDINEQSAIANQQGTATLVDALLEQSVKYAARAVLIGHLRSAGGFLWESNWHLHSGDNSQRFKHEAELPEQLAEEATDSLADTLARRYAGAASTGGVPESVVLTVRNLSSAADYARTERYLRALDNVKSLLVRRLDDSGIVFELNVHGGATALHQSISFGRTLAPDETQSGSYYLVRR